MTVRNNYQNNLKRPQGQADSHKSRQLPNFRQLYKIALPVLALVIAMFLVLTPLVLMGNSNNGTPLNVIYGLEENGDLPGDPAYTEEWDGRGTDSENCELAGEGPRDAEEGWIHWVFNTKGDSTEALLVLEGTGYDTYEPGEPLNAEVWHFYTPFFELEGLEATIYLYGGEEGSGGGLVISDYCPGVVEPLLTIEKVLLDADDEEITDSNVEFEFMISGGVFEEGETFPFSVNNPQKLDSDDGLEFGVEYTVEEVEHEEYEFVSISQSIVELTEGDNEITVTVVNRESEEEETGSIIIEKLVKRNVEDEEVIPSNKTFIFNIYDNATNELVRENVGLEVTDGEGFTEVNNLPLGEYRVEEVADEAYAAILDPDDGIVDISGGENAVTVVVTNTPRPVLTIEKILLDEEGVSVESSDIEFTVILDGGEFDEAEIAFSVNEPAVLDYTDGLEFNTEYTVTEIEHSGYGFVSINPDQGFELTEETHAITVTVTNEIEESNENGNGNGNGNGIENGNDNGNGETDEENGTLVILVVPEEPEVDPEEEMVLEPEEPEVEPQEKMVLEPEEPEVEPEEEEVVVLEPEEPETEPEEEVLVIEPEAPLATPATGGTQLALLSLGAVLTAGGILLRKYRAK